jgi:hypothetical protein
MQLFVLQCTINAPRIATSFELFRECLPSPFIKKKLKLSYTARLYLRSQPPEGSSHRDTALDAPLQNRAYDETPSVPGLGFHGTKFLKRDWTSCRKPKFFMNHVGRLQRRIIHDFESNLLIEKSAYFIDFHSNYLAKSYSVRPGSSGSCMG